MSRENAHFIKSYRISCCDKVIVIYGFIAFYLSRFIFYSYVKQHPNYTHNYTHN